jgi:hypothetical protein
MAIRQMVYLIFLCGFISVTSEAAGDVKFRWCGDTPSLSWGLAASDGNLTFEQYRYEFSVDPTFSVVTPIIVPKGKTPPMSGYTFLKYDIPYYVRVSVRNSDTDAWSAPGTVCSITARNSLKFKWCSDTPTLSWGLAADDGNSTFGQYQFEFATDQTFTNANAVTIPKEQTPALAGYPFLRYDVAYYVRVSVRHSDSDPWSRPGPTCRFIARNALSFKWCDTVVPRTYGLVATDGNAGAASYRFEFSTVFDFKTIFTVIELPRGQHPALSSYPQLLSNRVYYVRVFVRQRDADPWSLPGPVCTTALSSC